MAEGAQHIAEYPGVGSTHTLQTTHSGGCSPCRAAPEHSSSSLLHALTFAAPPHACFDSHCSSPCMTLQDVPPAESSHVSSTRFADLNISPNSKRWRNSHLRQNGVPAAFIQVSCPEGARPNSHSGFFHGKGYNDCLALPLSAPVLFLLSRQVV